MAAVSDMHNATDGRHAHERMAGNLQRNELAEQTTTLDDTTYLASPERNYGTHCIRLQGMTVARAVAGAIAHVHPAAHTPPHPPTYSVRVPHAIVPSWKSKVHDMLARGAHMSATVFALQL